MAFNNWPYTNFQDLNLGWILAKIKEALASAATAVAKAEAVESEVGTYSQRISDAEAEADSARNIANTARGEALNAQSDATSAIAIGQAARGTANSALNAANSAQDSADEAIDSASTAERNAAVALQSANIAETNSQNALNDYLNIGITVFPSGPAQADKNADEILAAVLANKKIKFTLDDARTGETHTTYDYTIDPVDNTTSDIDINVIFEISVSSSLNKYIIVTFHKVVSGGNTTYSITSTDVSFSGGGGGAVSGAVLYDSVQNLTAAQKAQARDNIGADSRPLILNVTESNGTFTVDKTAAEIRANLHNLALTFGLNEGVYIDSYKIYGSPPFTYCVFTVVDPTNSSVSYIEYDVCVYMAGMAPSQADDVPVVNRNLYTHNIGGGSVTVDSTLSGTSENPVQNKAITAEVNSLSSDLSILLEPDQTVNFYNGEYLFGFRSGSSGAVNENANFVYSKPIALDAGDYLFPSTETQMGTNNGRKVWVVNENGDVLSSIDGTVVGTKTQAGKYDNRNIIHFTMPSNGYVSINIGGEYSATGTVNQVNNFMVVRGTSIGDFPDYVPYSSGDLIFKPTISLTEKMTSQVNGLSGLIGKTAIFDGDSICAGTSVGDSEPTRGYGWAGRIGTANGMNWKNFGVDGGVITSASNASVSDKHSVCDNVDTMYTQYPNADFIIFEGGTNDADKAVTIGDVLANDFSGTYDTTTFCGALNTIFYKATNYWKGKAIGYIVSHKMGRGANNRTTRETYFAAAKSVCEKWGVPVIDLWDGCYLNPDNPNLWNQSLTNEQNIAQGYLYTDGQHLTAKGYDYISPMIEDWMKGI